MKIARRVSRPGAILRRSKLHPILETAPSRENAIKAGQRSLKRWRSADCGLAFKGGNVKWNQDLPLLIVTGASWAGEEDTVKGRIEPLRSQRVRFNGLARPGFIEENSDHQVCVPSKVIKRVRKSTQQAGTQTCVWGVESGVRIRAAVADARGMLGAGKKLPTNWEDKSAISIRH
eukprot:7419243-Pyramimonas_sp.AAC.1